jgi:alanyl-tRNA synthetase
MLGNFSFGDYFKEDAILMSWELLTGKLGINPDRLWVTVFEEDDEAWDIWRSKVNFPEERLQRLDAKENFWSMGETGPCGPCSEIHYDHGPSVSADTSGPAGGGDRYVEFWNLVFMQYEQRSDGTRVGLPRPSIDTGAGLERMAAILQGVYWNYDTDLFTGIMGCAAKQADVAYGVDSDSDTALRVIADHSRATAFLVADGVMPSNEGRGYVLRRIMRRAIRFGVKLGIGRPFFHETVNQVIGEYGDVYPELGERKQFIGEIVQAEEDRFRSTLDRGIKLLDSELERVGNGGTIPGEIAFTLSDTFGFPLDLTQLIATEKGISVDSDGFNAALETQRARGRAAWRGSGEESVGELWHELSRDFGETSFSGYTQDQDVAEVLALVRRVGDQLTRVDSFKAGDQGAVLIDRSPFYGESGGQVGDTGTIGFFQVNDTQKASGLALHWGHLQQGELSLGDQVQAAVEAARRDNTRRNHTATHLLHAALRDIVGEHVTQKGSLVGPNRLRFDFSHHKPLTAAEIRLVEDSVNAEIRRNSGVETTLRTLDEALEDGAMALFGEKYDERVRVVSVPGYSVELCGGTHVCHTGDIGMFRIVSEGGVAAGVRRLEAQTAAGAMEVVRTESSWLGQVAAALKTSPDTVLDSVRRLQEERKSLERELTALRREMAKDAAGDLLAGAREVGGIKVLAAEFSGDLREQADRLRDQLGSGVVVLAARRGSKVQLLAAATKDIAGSRVHAGKLIQVLAPLVDGRGGGRPDMAQAGGSKPEGIPALIDEAYGAVAKQLGL